SRPQPRDVRRPRQPGRDRALLRGPRRLRADAEHRQHADLGHRGVCERVTGRLDRRGRRAGDPHRRRRRTAGSARRSRGGGRACPRAAGVAGSRTRARAQRLRAIACLHVGVGQAAMARRLPRRAASVRRGSPRCRGPFGRRGSRSSGRAPRMSRRALDRLARMSAREARWRLGSAARAAARRAMFAVRPPRWMRPPDADARHREISEQVAASTRFVIVPSRRASLVTAIERACPHSARHAAARADRVLFGDYDLLGYRGLRFDGSGRFEWDYDPVHDRRAPGGFWRTVPYLDPAIGDHKIVWDLNRHQHWIALGRAHWLTGERKYRDRCLAELASWLDANPPLAGINWTSMLEVALRSLSWLWALHFFADPHADDSSPWTVDLVQALDRQLTHVEQNLSYYFSPNTHLLGEALALYVAGRTLPELASSPRRAHLGRRILVGEMARQIAPDGGHCERSAHYHRYTLDFYALALAVARITRDPIAPAFERALLRLGSAARSLCDDTGRAPHFGDDDGGSLLPIAGRAADDWRDSLAIAALLTGHSELQIGLPPEEAHWMLSHPAFAQAWPSQPDAVRSSIA